MLRRWFLASIWAAVAGACWPWKKAEITYFRLLRQDVTDRTGWVDAITQAMSEDDDKHVVIWNGHAQYWEIREIECPKC